MACKRTVSDPYVQNGACSATVASNASVLDEEGIWTTSHSLRHTFRDRLRNAHCPLELIDQIVGGLL